MADYLEIKVRGFKFKYLAKPGVFSKNGLDQGTKLLLENIKVRNESLVADLGGGAGIVSLVLAKLNSYGHVHLLDDHLRSINLALENVQLNGIRNIEVFTSDLFSAVERRTYHQIFSNPPQQLGNEFLKELIEQSKMHLKPNGELWLVVKNNVRPVLERMVNEVFQNCGLVKTGKGHSVLKSLNTL